MKTTSEITVYELNGQEPDEEHIILIESHWVDEGKVVLVIAGVRYAVAARQLQAAVESARRVPR